MCNKLRANYYLFIMLTIMMSGMEISFSVEQIIPLQTLVKVAEAIKQGNENAPGDLLKLVKTAAPNVDAIIAMRELNKAMDAGKIIKDATIINKQKAAQKNVRKMIIDIRKATMQEFFNDPKISDVQKRSLYGYGDFGSWINSIDPDVNMDVDLTFLGVDPAVSAMLRDRYIDNLQRELAGTDNKISLKDFDIVVTAEGNEVAAGVFETPSGIIWAKRNLKFFTLLKKDGSEIKVNLEKKVDIYKRDPNTNEILKDNMNNPIIERTITVIVGDPIREMSYAEMMARFKAEAASSGDYDLLFDKNGLMRNIKESSKKLTTVIEKQEVDVTDVWERHKETLSKFGIDYYITSTETAFGGCLDMAKHLQKEAINREYESDAKLKKILKFVIRARNIFRTSQAMAALEITDGVLIQEKATIDLARRISSASPDEISGILTEKFGATPDAGLVELGKSARRTILRMASLSFQAEMDRIVLKIPTPTERAAAIKRLRSDAAIICNEGDDFKKIGEMVDEQARKVEFAEKQNLIENVRKNWTDIEKISKTEPSVIEKTKRYLSQTEMGSKMLDAYSGLIEFGNTDIEITDSDGFAIKSPAAIQALGAMQKLNSKLENINDKAGKVGMLLEIFNSGRSSSTGTEFAISMGKMIANTNTYCAVFLSLYDMYNEGSLKDLDTALANKDKIAKLVLYTLYPVTGLPELIYTMGQTTVNTGLQIMFDSNMEDQYTASKFDGEKILDLGGTGLAGQEGALMLVDQLLGKERKAVIGLGATVAKVGASYAVSWTINDGVPKIFTSDSDVVTKSSGLKRCISDANDIASLFNVKLPADAIVNGSWADSSDKAQKNVVNIINALLTQGNRFRKETRSAVAAAILRTFEERRRAEVAIDKGRDSALAELDKMKACFERLGILNQGMTSMDSEGVPFGSVFTSTKEKQIQAMKTLQKFQAAYTTVENTRESVIDAVYKVMGDEKMSVWPLYGYIPLTANPDNDKEIASACLDDVSTLPDHIKETLERIKGSPLAGDYDNDMVKKIYRLSFDRACKRSVIKSIGYAQKLSWSFRFYTAVTLNRKRDEAINAGVKLNTGIFNLQEEFRNHYLLSGKLRIKMNAPDKLPSGSEARMICTVEQLSVKTKEWLPVPAEILNSLTYTWYSGKNLLGANHSAERQYRLDTIGEHQFTVKISQTRFSTSKTTIAELGEASCLITVIPAILQIRINGKNTAQLNEEVGLTVLTIGANATLPADERIIWKIDDKKIGTGKKCIVKSGTAGQYNVTCEILDTNNVTISASASFKIVFGKNLGTGTGTVSAIINGAVSTAIEGGGVSINAAKFLRGNINVILTEYGNTTVLDSRWQASWYAVNPDSKAKIPARPRGWGIDRFNIVWKSSGAATFTPATTVNDQQTSIIFSKRQSINIWGVIQQNVNGVITVVGETNHVTVNIESSRFDVRLKAEKTTLRPGQPTNVTVSMTGGKAPYKIEWSGNHAGDGEKVLFVSRLRGSNILSVQVTDSLNRVGAASISLQVTGVTATLTGLEEKQVFYGTSKNIRLTMDGFTPTVIDTPKPPTNNSYDECNCTGKKHNPNNPFCDKDRKTVKTSVSTSDSPPDIPINIPVSLDTLKTTGNTNPQTKPAVKDTRYRFVYQSDPALTFNTSTSLDGATKITFDRMGAVSIWVEIQERMPDGNWETADELEPILINVISPAFSVLFSPTESRVGKEVQAEVKSQPSVKNDLMEIKWETPASSEWASRSTNESVISFTPRSAQAIAFRASARVPYWGDIISSEISASYTASEYPVVITVKGTGKPPVQIWKEGVGLVTVEAGSYAVDEHVNLSASLTNGPPEEDIRWSWTVNEGSTFTGTGSGNSIAVSRNETGNCEAKVTARNTDGVFLGSQSVTVGFSISAEQINTTRQKSVNITASLTSGRTQINSGEKILISAGVVGGTTPYKYSWTGPIMPNGANASFTAMQTGQHKIMMTVTDAKGKNAYAELLLTVKAVPLSVSIESTGTASVYTAYPLTASVKGGFPPYQYAWTGGIEGQGDKVRLVAEAVNNINIGLKVTDSRGNTGYTTKIIAVNSLVPVITLYPPQPTYGCQRGVTLEFPHPPQDSPLRIQARPSILWHSDPPLRMLASTSFTNPILFDRLGKVSIWADIINRNGMIIGTTEKKVLIVVSPNFSIQCFPPGLQVNQEVTATIKANPPIERAMVLNYNWKVSDDQMINPNEPVICRFTPRDTRPVDIRVSIKNPTTGEVICSDLRSTYQAAPLTLAAFVVKTLPPTPRVVSYGKIVDLAGAFAVKQRVMLSMKLVRGTLRDDVKFRWSLNKGSYFDDDNEGRQVAVYRKEVGGCMATVTALSANGKEIGTATVQFDVKVNDDQLDEAEKLAKAQSQPVKTASKSNTGTKKTGKSLFDLLNDAEKIVKDVKTVKDKVDTMVNGTKTPASTPASTPAKSTTPPPATTPAKSTTTTPPVKTTPPAATNNTKPPTTYYGKNPAATMNNTTPAKTSPPPPTTSKPVKSIPVESEKPVTQPAIPHVLQPVYGTPVNYSLHVEFDEKSINSNTSLATPAELAIPIPGPGILKYRIVVSPYSDAGDAYYYNQKFYDKEKSSNRMPDWKEIKNVKYQNGVEVRNSKNGIPLITEVEFNVKDVRPQLFLIVSPAVDYNGAGRSYQFAQTCDVEVTYIPVEMK